MESDPITRTCKDCGRQFTEDLAQLKVIAERAGWRELRIPTRCYPCRRLVREAPHVVLDDGLDEHLVCVDCGQPFIFGGRDKAYFAAQGFSTPRRCRACRHARASQRPPRFGAW